MAQMPWLQIGADYTAKVMRAAHLLSIPLQNSWFSTSASSSTGGAAGGAGAGAGAGGAPLAAPATASLSSLAAAAAAAAASRGRSPVSAPVVEAFIWHHVVSLATASGTRINESVTEMTPKAFTETLGHVLLKHDAYAGKKESDGEAFFVDMMLVWVVCLVHELRALATGTTLAIVTGERGSGATTVASVVQQSAASLRHASLPLAYLWVVDVFPLPDLIGEALQLFPNVALLYVVTLDSCAADSDVLHLSSTTQSLIQAHRHGIAGDGGVPSMRHKQWLVVNKIDAASAAAAASSSSSSSTGQGTTRSDGAAEYVRRARATFAATACQTLTGWQAERLLVCVAADPKSWDVTAAETSELRALSAGALRDCVREISMW